MEEYKKGLRIIRDGEKYVSPTLKLLLENPANRPCVDKNQNITKRHKECLLMLCCGYKTASIGEKLHISKSTVENHLQCLYNIFHANSREEMIAIAWRLDLVTKDDLQFYDDRTINLRTYGSTLPDWAEAKINFNRSAGNLHPCRLPA